MNFIIGGCYFSIKKNHDHLFILSDILTISYYSSNKNMKEATEKIHHALEFFIFLTFIPYDTNGTITESIENSLPTIDINLSKKKMLNIQTAKNAYQHIRKKRKLLENIIHLYALGVKLHYLLPENIPEDAFFTFFKIVEKIVKDDFSIEKHNIDRGTLLTQNYVESILNHSYGIQTTSKRLSDICGIIDTTIFDSVFDSIYHKIIWFSQKHNISINCDILSKIVNIRNKIAHGENTDFEQCSEEYEYIIDLANKIILAKFFTLSLPKIETHLNIN